MCIQTTIREGSLTFNFNPEYQKASKYDEWNFYKSHIGLIQERKGVDIVCIDESQNFTYLIEIKDFREQAKNRGDEKEKRQNKQWDQDVAKKIIDSIAGLHWASICNFEDEEIKDTILRTKLKGEAEFAKKALSKPIRIIFHCEISENEYDLLMPIYDKLFSIFKGIDKNLIVDCNAKRYNWEIEKREPPSNDI